MRETITCTAPCRTARNGSEHHPNLSAISLIYIKATGASDENCRSTLPQFCAASLKRLAMHPPSVTTDHRFPIPESMQAWVLGDPGQLIPTRKPVPMPGRSEVMVRI